MPLFECLLNLFQSPSSASSFVNSISDGSSDITVNQGERCTPSCPRGSRGACVGVRNASGRCVRVGEFCMVNRSEAGEYDRTGSCNRKLKVGGSCGKNRVYNNDRRCVSVGSRCDFYPCPVGMNTRACRRRAGVMSVNGTCQAAPAYSSPPPAKHVLHFEPSLQQQQQTTSTFVETTSDETYLSEDESWDTAMWPATPDKSFFFLDE